MYKIGLVRIVAFTTYHHSSCELSVPKYSLARDTLVATWTNWLEQAMFWRYDCAPEIVIQQQYLSQGEATFVPIWATMLTLPE